jgi:hypothetical protein
MKPEKSIFVVLVAANIACGAPPSRLPSAELGLGQCDLDSVDRSLSASCQYGPSSEFIFSGIIESVEMVSWPARVTVDGVERVIQREQDGCVSSHPAMRVQLSNVEALRGELKSNVAVLIETEILERWQPSPFLGKMDGYMVPGTVLGMGANRGGEDLVMGTLTMFSLDGSRIINQGGVLESCSPGLDVATIEDVRTQLAQCTEPTHRVPAVAVVPRASCPQTAPPGCSANAECGPGTICNAASRACEAP